MYSIITFDLNPGTRTNQSWYAEPPLNEQQFNNYARTKMKRDANVQIKTKQTHVEGLSITA